MTVNRAHKISTEYRPITDFTQVAIVVRHQDGTFGLEAHTSRSRVAISLEINIGTQGVQELFFMKFRR